MFLHTAHLCYAELIEGYRQPKGGLSPERFSNTRHGFPMTPLGLPSGTHGPIGVAARGHLFVQMDPAKCRITSSLGAGVVLESKTLVGYSTSRFRGLARICVLTNDFFTSVPLH